MPDVDFIEDVAFVEDKPAFDFQELSPPLAEGFEQRAVELDALKAAAPAIEPAKSTEELTLRRLEFNKQFGLSDGREQSFMEMATTPLWEIAKKVNPQQFADAMDALAVVFNPNKSLDALADPSRKPTALESGLAGAQQAAADAVNFFTSPLGIATLGTAGAPAAIQKTVAGAFVVDMATQYPKMIRELSAGIRENDAEKIGRSVTGLGLNTAFIKTGLESVFSKGKAIDPTLPDTLRQADAPLTAAVIEGGSPGAGSIGGGIKAALGQQAEAGAIPLPSVPAKVLEKIDKLMPRSAGTPPPINPDTSTPLPDFQPHEVSKKIATEPFGIGRLPVLGPLLDPRTRIRDNTDESISTYHYERGVGRAISSALGEQLRGTIDKHFDVDPKTSEIRNIGTAAEGQSRHISDVFEALQKDPNAYTLTPEQRTAFGELVKLDADMRVLEDKYELFQDPGSEYQSSKPTREETYFPRIVIERPPQDVAPLKGGGMVGGKQFFQKERLFETEAEGVKKGYRYEPSIEARIVTRAERLYKAIADKRLANDPALGAKTRKGVEAELREAYGEELGSGEMTEQKLQQIVDSLEGKGRVWQPAFFGKIFDAATANKLNQAFPNADSTFRKGFVDTNNALKAIRLSLDLGVAQLQGLPTLYKNPRVWGKAQWNSLKALIDKTVFPEYVRENLGPIREMAQMGSSVGRLEEQLAGVGKEQFVTRIPVVGKGFEAFGRQFQTFLDVAKVELWKGLREVTPKEQWQSVMQSIESQLLTARMETIGVSRNRAMVERAMLLAPSYYRGAINLVGAMGERGVSGQVARRALGAYLAGGVAAYVGMALAMGMDEKEIVERLNPARPDFMMWSMETETGRKFNAGFGGIYRSLLRLGGNVVKTSIEHPEHWASLAPDKNPFVRWYRGHAAPLPGMIWDAFSGKDFAGYEADIATVGQSVKPMVLQALEQKPGQPKPSVVDVGLSFLGMSAYPESLHLQFGREREELAQKLYQKPYDSLTMAQSARVTKEVQKMPAFAVREPATALQRERAFKADQERIVRINEGLTKESREKLKDLGIKVSGYEPSFTQAGTTVPLTRTQQQEYEKLVIEEYEKVIGRLNTKAFKNLPEKRRQEILSERLSDAKLIARRKLFRNP